MNSISFDLTIKNAGWFVLKHGPVILDLMSQEQGEDEEIGYSYEDYIETIVSVIELAKDVFGEADAKGGRLKEIYDAAYGSCESFLNVWYAAQHGVQPTADHASASVTTQDDQQAGRGG